MADYVQNSNLIPKINSVGKFTATAPFDSVFDPKTNYRVLGIRTFEELEANGFNIFEKVLKPVGVSEADSQALIKKAKSLNGVVVVFGLQGSADIYVPSTFIPSLPDVTGVEYERLCIIADLGAVPVFLKDRINAAKAHFADYILSHIGVSAKTVTLGSLPSSEFVTEEQANIFESTRQNAIANAKSDTVIIKNLTDKVAAQQAYIKKLEDALKAKVVAK